MKKVGSSGIVVNDDEHQIIIKLVEDEPASKCGLMIGDKLIKINGYLLSNLRHTQVRRVLEPGEVLTFTVLRNGEELSFPITLVEREISNSAYEELIRKDDK